MQHKKAHYFCGARGAWACAIKSFDNSQAFLRKVYTPSQVISAFQKSIQTMYLHPEENHWLKRHQKLESRSPRKLLGQNYRVDLVKSHKIEGRCWLFTGSQVPFDIERSEEGALDIVGQSLQGIVQYRLFAMEAQTPKVNKDRARSRQDARRIYSKKNCQAYRRACFRRENRRRDEREF